MRAVVLTLALMLAACAQPASQQRSASASLDLLSRLPPRIDIATLASGPERDTAPGITEGALARYRMPFGTATVFLFSTEAAPVPPGPDSAQVRQHLQDATGTLAFVGALQAAGEAGRGGVAWKRHPDFSVRGAGGQSLRCTETWRVPMEPRGPEPRAEYVCVTGVQDRILKVRVTIRDPGAATASARNWAGELSVRAASALAPAARS